jgi:hypothetical protein
MTFALQKGAVSDAHSNYTARNSLIQFSFNGDVVCCKPGEVLIFHTRAFNEIKLGRYLPEGCVLSGP